MELLISEEKKIAKLANILSPFVPPIFLCTILQSPLLHIAKNK
jgi:hypothetical protein